MELIVVITILAILATVGFLSLSGYSDDARTATVKANVRTVYSAILTESTTSGNSPRYYVDHGTGAALSWAFVFVDGKQVALTGGNLGEAPADSNYTAGNPRWDRLRMNGDKFRLSSGRAGCADGGAGNPVSGSCAFAKSPEAGISASAGGLPYAFERFGVPGNDASAAYSTGELAVGAVDVFKVGANGRKRATPYFQVAGVVSGSKATVVSGNFAWGTAGGLIKNPGSSDAAYSLADGIPSASPIPESCKAVKAANPSAGDGAYRIDPDGSGTGAAISVYCDMTTDGGGWTLVMKANALTFFPSIVGKGTTKICASIEDECVTEGTSSFYRGTPVQPKITDYLFLQSPNGFANARTNGPIVLHNANNYVRDGVTAPGTPLFELMTDTVNGWHNPLNTAADPSSKNDPTRLFYDADGQNWHDGNWHGSVGQEGMQVAGKNGTNWGHHHFTTVPTFDSTAGTYSIYPWTYYGMSDENFGAPRPVPKSVFEDWRWAVLVR